MPPWKKAVKSIPDPKAEPPASPVGAAKRLSRYKAATGAGAGEPVRSAGPAAGADLFVPRRIASLGPRIETTPTGFPEVDKVNRDLLDVRNELRLVRARLAEIEAKTKPGLEYAERLAGGRFDPEEFLRVDPSSLPPRARKEVEDFMEEMRRAEAAGEYRSTRGLGRHLGRMI